MSRKRIQDYYDSPGLFREELPSRVDQSLYRVVNCDAFDWLDSAQACSIEAVVTDPPYGLIEYSEEQLRKRKTGKGGVWRIPPSFDGCQRAPLPRFTVLRESERKQLREFFARLAKRLMRVMVPGAHAFIATNPLVSHLVYEPFISAGFEKRGELIRLVQTLRGGDRPKNAEREFEMVTVMPRAWWEPWGLLESPAKDVFRTTCESGERADCVASQRTNRSKTSSNHQSRKTESEPFPSIPRSSHSTL